MTRLNDLRIRQLDETLTPIRRVHTAPVPRDGWLRSVREALGMSLREVAERAGLSKTSVHSAETNEASGSVRLDTLQTLAEAMDCRLVYAVVPRNGSLRDLLEEQAERIARRVVGRVSDSMDLEAQSVASDEQARQVEELKAEILRERGRGFWDV